MEELRKVSAGLRNSSTLLLKQKASTLECQFLKEGLVWSVVPVKNQALAAVLRQKSVHGIIEGSALGSLKGTLEHLSLRLKAQQLYQELQVTLHDYTSERSALAIAS